MLLFVRFDGCFKTLLAEIAPCWIKKLAPVDVFPGITIILKRTYDTLYH